MNCHELKCWPSYFIFVWAGTKKFEIRKNDRNFQAGDMIILKEWDPETEEYTGRELHGYINCVVLDCIGLDKDYCVFGFTSHEKRGTNIH